MSTKPKLRTFKAKNILPHPSNPRIITPDDVAKVQRSIEKYGYQARIIVDKKRVVIAGHTRLQALIALGYDDIEVVQVEMSEDKAREFRIIDNRSSELADWNPDLLLPELREFADPEDLHMFFPDVDLSINFSDDSFEIDERDLEKAQVILDKRLADTRVLNTRTIECPECHEHFEVSG